MMEDKSSCGAANLGPSEDERSGPGAVETSGGSADSPNLDRGTRKKYHPPNLACYGSVAALTAQFGPGPSSDKGDNMMGFS